jgi:tetratricopeptide (TPR) repeat protein
MKNTLFRRTFCLLAAAAAIFIFTGTGVSAAVEPTQEQQDRVEAVGGRLLAAIKTHPTEYTWPPIIKVTTEIGEDNACAYVREDKDTGKMISHMSVSPSLLIDIIKDNDDTLALVMGHELSHVLLKHVTPHPDRDKTPYLGATFTRQQEYEADENGMKLALAAGYSFRLALVGPREFIRQGLDYSSFEGSGFDHPSWKDRIAALDKDQALLWRSMSAFDNGRYFLTAEQYGTAGQCFAGIVSDFPDCTEAWSNLGYSKLMQYCDGLETNDIRKMGIGQIVVGGFYQRPYSLETKVRGQNPQFWKEAVEALQHALTLNPKLTLAKSDLALAYLVAPDGKNTARASQLFQEAATLAAGDTTIDSYTRAAVLVNAGVSDIALGQLVAGRQKIDRGEQAMTALAGPNRAAASALADAVLYNRALLLANSAAAPDQTEAMAEMEKYLHSASPASAWWPLAFERYTALCKANGSVPTTEAALRAAATVHLRPLTSLEIVPGNPLHWAK